MRRDVSIYNMYECVQCHVCMQKQQNPAAAIAADPVYTRERTVICHRPQQTVLANATRQRLKRTFTVHFTD